MHVDVNSCIIGNLVGKGSREMLTVFSSPYLFLGLNIFNGMNC